MAYLLSRDGQRACQVELTAGPGKTPCGLPVPVGSTETTRAALSSLVYENINPGVPKRQPPVGWFIEGSMVVVGKHLTF